MHDITEKYLKCNVPCENTKQNVLHNKNKIKIKT